jgi:tetratricopeptide (TPR) repeat protein
MLENITREEIPSGLAEAVYRQTEGNPLFVQELARYFVEEGFISREREQWRVTKDIPLEMSIPEGLRDVVGKRLSSLSQECNRILSIASVIGREFRLEVLQKIADVSDNELFTGLEEAKGAAVVEERSTVGAAVTYRFSHAFFRQTLYEEIIAPRRIRLHQKVGQALEEIYVKQLDEHAAELAEHFSYSPDVEGLAKAVSYGEMAAERTITVYAYGEAVRLLEQALKVHEVLDPDDKAKRCDLLVGLCTALIHAGDPRRVLDVEATVALSLAEDIGDRTRASSVCHRALEALSYYAESGTMLVESETAQWTERADRYAEPDTLERAVADSMLGAIKYTTGHPKEGIPLISRSVDLARRLGDPATYWMTAAQWLYCATAPQHAEERLQLAVELTERSRAGVSIPTLGWALMFASHTFFVSGQRQRTEEVWSELQGLAKRTQQANYLLWSMGIDADMATLDGRLEEAMEIVQNIRTHGQELGLTGFARMVVNVSGLRSLLLLTKADDAIQPWIRAAPAPPARALCLAYLGQDAEVVEILEQRVLTRAGIGSVDDETPAWLDVMCLEAAVLVGHREVVGLLLRRFDGTNCRIIGPYNMTCIARHLGGATALLGRPEEARNHYQEAIRVCTEMRFRPELALTRLQLAELVLEHYPDEKSEALAHLDFAINEFREMKMQPSLERALRHKEILGA